MYHFNVTKSDHFDEIEYIKFSLITLDILIKKTSDRERNKLVKSNVHSFYYFQLLTALTIYFNQYRPTEKLRFIEFLRVSYYFLLKTTIILLK